eukprot:gene10975-17087_t
MRVGGSRISMKDMHARIHHILQSLAKRITQYNETVKLVDDKCVSNGLQLIHKPKALACGTLLTPMLLWKDTAADIGEPST